MILILVAATVALCGTLLGTRVAIGFLAARGYGQLIRDDGPTTHHTKRGTPTMGGSVIMAAAVLGYAVAHLVRWIPPTASGLLVLFLMLGLGCVGFVDDYVKVVRQRSLGLRARAKLAGQAGVAVVFALLALRLPDARGLTPASLDLSFTRDLGLALPPLLFVAWAWLMVAAASNGVNLTDGLDGLAAGASTMVFAAYVIICLWQFNESCASVEGVGPKCYEVRDSIDLAIVAAAMMGACFGFLWWNASPAKIFMGDTGSLALGGALAGLAITTRTELLLVVIGGLFVVITMSAVVQIGWFKLSGGRRVFRMAPLQHHFEMGGWAEITIVIRFWIICGVFVALGLGVFYAEWVTGL